ncbi:MAG: hypothetical protein AB1762_14170, partial [Gemmatimonadota bacterium]
ERVPGMLLVAAACLVAAGALGYGAARLFRLGSGVMHLLGTLTALAAFLVLLLAVAAVVFFFGVDFK